MVVHRGSSWDALPDTSHRSTLQAINQNTLPQADNDTISVCKQNTEEQPSLIEWKNPFNMRQVILNNLTTGGRPTGLLRHSHVSPWSRVRGRPVTNAAKSLDILRQNLQTSINKEIDAVLKKYLEKFFRPAIDNVRSNLGGSSVSEEHVREVCRAMLDEAKQMYCGPLSRGGSPFSDCETTSLIESRLRRTHSQSPLLRKRKESDTDSETSQTVALRKRISRPLCSNWDSSRLGKDTLFILGSRANKVLGLGHVLGKGRLFIKHPQLFKYCSDQQDQDWLTLHRHTLTPLSSTKVYVMLLDEIKELVSSDEYRNSPSVLTHELKGFEAPDFMLKKIKMYMSQVKPQPSEDPESPSDTSQGVPSNLSVECVSSTMTPPTTVLDSGPSTPSEALDLLDPPSYLTLPEEQRRDDTLSALLNRATTAHD